MSTEVATETSILRDELKSWENTFKLDNGRKPSREDIKSNAAIAAKYKRFNSLRCPEYAKPPVETPKKNSRRRDVPDDALKERAPNAATTTPRGRAFKSLDNAQPQPPILSPVREEQPTPAFIRNGLGPTPQRDGHVLGIFDMLPNGTPSKRSPSPSEEHGDAVHATPSKNSTRAVDSALSRTPQSSSKRYFLDAFITTPGKRKREDDEVGTPSSSKKLFATPSFLRRVSHPMAPTEEDDSHAMLPPRRMKPLSRSFSSIIQELKNQEEERMEDDWDVLNELEGGDDNTAVPKKQAEPVQVSDSQLVVMPLGPDRAPGESESEEEVALGANGLPRKVYKKKGLKRQTRKTNIKPVLHKPKKAADLEEKAESDDEEAVGETQLDGTESNSVQDARQENTDKDAEKSMNPIKKVAQKVSQNFRKMNIKSHQTSKQKAAKSRGRFGKR
jgi:DNA replication regulator SLD2